MVGQLALDLCGQERTDEMLEEFPLLLNARRLVLRAIATGPSLDHAGTSRRTVELNTEDARSRPTAMEIEPFILEEYEPLIVHVFWDMSLSKMFEFSIGEH